MSMCESHTGLEGGEGWEGGVSYTDLVGVGLGGGVEDDLVSYLLLLFLQLCDCWFILVLWFSCSGLRWIRLLTSFPLSLFFLSLLFMLLFLLRFILAVFSFRFFSLGFLRKEREGEEKTFRISFEYTNQVLEDRMLHEKIHYGSLCCSSNKNSRNKSRMERIDMDLKWRMQTLYLRLPRIFLFFSCFFCCTIWWGRRGYFRRLVTEWVNQAMKRLNLSINQRVSQ